MGAELNNSNGKPDSNLDSGASGAASKPAAGHTSPTAAGAGGTSSAAASGGGTKAGTKEKEKPAAVSAVVNKDNEVPAPAEPKKKATRKRSSKKKKEPEASYNAAQLQALILSGSAILATRENMSMFALSPEEAQQLAVPIANMIEKSEKLKNMGEYADAIALATAALLIFIPRFMLFADVKKKEKLRKNGGVKLVKESEIKRDNKRNDVKPADQHADDGQNFRSILSPVDGF